MWKRVKFKLTVTVVAAFESWASPQAERVCMAQKITYARLLAIAIYVMLTFQSGTAEELDGVRPEAG